MTNHASIPLNFICPITHDIMHNPVLLVEDGHSYEQSALELWFQEHNTSPLTNEELKTKTFVLNYNLKATIEEFSRQKNERKSRISFRSSTLRRGRPQNDEWKNSPRLRIIISLLGPSNVGKSCLADNIEYGLPQENYHARVTLAVDIGFFYLDQLFENKYVIIIQINDCPGTDRFEAVSDRHFRNCHGAILMVDTTDIETFERLQNYWYKQLCEKSLFDHVETVLACNKIDLLERNYDSFYRDEFFKRANTFASQYQMPIFNISALRGDNIQKMFHQLISNILENQSLIQILKQGQIKNHEQIYTQNLTIQVDQVIKSSKSNKKLPCC